MAKTVSEVFVETLIAAGVQRVYGVVGDSLNGSDGHHTKKVHKLTGCTCVMKKQRPSPQEPMPKSLDESPCAPAVVVPGIFTLSMVFMTVIARGVPVLAIAAQIPSSEIGSGYFQETHPEHLFKDCSHYCELVSQPEQMPRVLGIAMRTAIGETRCGGRGHSRRHRLEAL